MFTTVQNWVVDDLSPLIETLGSFQIYTNPKGVEEFRHQKTKLAAKRGEETVHLNIYSFLGN